MYLEFRTFISSKVFEFSYSASGKANIVFLLHFLCVNGTLVPGVTMSIEKVQIEIKFEGGDLVVLSQKK